MTHFCSAANIVIMSSVILIKTTIHLTNVSWLENLYNVSIRPDPYCSKSHLCKHHYPPSSILRIALPLERL